MIAGLNLKLQMKSITKNALYAVSQFSQSHLSAALKGGRDEDHVWLSGMGLADV